MASYPRVLWLVRHAEREDNINRSWQNLPAATGLAADNSMLSARGKQQAAELAARFKNEKLAHVFASPFDRTMETAHVIVEGNADQQLLVKPEPGLLEALYLCEKPFPSFWETAKLKLKFPRVDEDYDPVYSKHAMPKEGYGDDACVPRLRETLRRLCARFTGPLLLVGHGASIGALHEILTGNFLYVGQATVSKFVEVAEGKFNHEYSTNTDHLSNKHNLRPY